MLVAMFLNLLAIIGILICLIVIYAILYAIVSANLKVFKKDSELTQLDVKINGIVDDYVEKLSEELLKK